jgi:hypothetical protein
LAVSRLLLLLMMMLLLLWSFGRVSVGCSLTTCAGSWTTVGCSVWSASSALLWTGPVTALQLLGRWRQGTGESWLTQHPVVLFTVDKATTA